MNYAQQKQILQKVLNDMNISYDDIALKGGLFEVYSNDFKEGVLQISSFDADYQYEYVEVYNTFKDDIKYLVKK